MAEDELEQLITNACRFPVAEAEPEVVIGKPKPVASADWRMSKCNRRSYLPHLRSGPLA